MNLYQTCYDLICEYVFANQGVVDGVLIDQMQHLIATLVSTMGWLFLVALPFLVVWKVICFIAGSCWR